MSSKRNRHLMLRKTMAGLLSMAMVVTIVTPASGNAYASALDEETAKAVLEQVAEPSDSETPEAEPVAEEEAPAEAAEEAVPEEAVAEEITGETVDLYAAQSVFKNEDVESIQAFTDYNFYGLRLNRIVIQFRNGTNMTGAGNAENYKVWDRAFQKGEFEEAGAKGAIDSVDVEGFTVTLNFSQNPAGNEAFGMMCTSLWAVAETSDGTYEIKSKGQGDGKDYQYFTRENLDLVLGLGQAATQEEGIASTDTFGHMLAGTVWQEQDNGIYDEFNLTWVDAADEEDATRFEAQDGRVPVHYYVPDSYDADEGMPLVLYVTGNGTSYWEAWDGDSHKIGDGKVISNNLGTNVSYDEAVSQWAETGEVIVASPDVHSDKNKSAATDVANTIKYFQENYNISKVILSGNSNGTGITSQCVRDYTELVDVFLNYNGWFGDGPNQIFSSDRQKATWPEESVQHIADEGVAIWFFNGEKDPLANPQFTVNAYKQLIPYYQAAGWSDEWIADNLRISGFKDYKFVEWGVNDHSVTKVVASNYITSPYRDVYEDGGLLNAGDNYYMSDATRDDVKQFAYTVYPESVKDWALGDHSEGHTATPIEESAAAPASIGSYQKRNGYFTYQVKVGETTREVELYIPDGARQREYWICMTLPNGVNSTQFLENANWFETADQDSACLLIMKPENGTWGNVEDEMAYVNAAMGTLASNGKYYSAFTYDYLVGYGEGAPALQLWAAQNPLKMISQVYVNAQADAAYDALLKEAGDTQVGQTPQPNNMNFDGYKDKDGNEITQKRTFAAQSYKDIPIPTWFIGNTSESIVNYWKDANDCVADGTADASYGTIYWQSEDSDAIATSFSDIQTQVAVQENAEDVYGSATTESIYDFLTYYSGYDNNSVYGHFITKRLDYNDAIESGNLKAVDHEWNGTVRSYLVYVPDSVKKMDGPAPVVFANHGAGQTAFVFMEATDIKEAADKYGFIAVTFDVTSNADYMADLYEMVKADCEEMGVTMDESRVYAYGQSAGGGSVANTMAQSKKVVDLFAAFGMTSGIHTVAQADGSDKIVPMYAIYGEYDYWPMKLGAIGAGEWTGSQKTQYAWTTDTQSYWANRLLGMTLDELTDENNYTVVDGIGASLVPENTPISLIINPTATANRYKTYTWSLADGTPIFNWSQCYGRGHNLIPTDLDELWTKWYSKWQKVDDSTVAYWADGVGNGESVLVNQYPAEDVKELKDLDAITELPYDFSQAAQLPLTGYFTKAIGEEGRTVKVYISEEASIRSYFTVVAVPDGVSSTTKFLEENGWFDLADAKGEGLIVLEPADGQWGTREEEQDYVNAAMSFARSGRNANNVPVFSVYGEFYLVGYGASAAPLEAWAAEWPIYVISQVYIDGTGAGRSYLDATGAKEYDGTNTSGYDGEIKNFDSVLAALGISERMKKSDVPVPTWFIGYDENDYSITYWKQANDAIATTEAGVYRQSIKSTALQTEYANATLRKEQPDTKYGIAQVKVSNDGAVTAEDIYSWMSIYTRYDNTFAYSNALGYRLDYTAATVAAQQAAKNLAADDRETLTFKMTGGEKGEAELWASSAVKVEAAENAAGSGTVIVGIASFADNGGLNGTRTPDGENDPREYIFYVPDSAKEKAGENGAPAIVIYPGNSQTDRIFMDSTMWWKIADEEGIVLAFVCETYSNNSVSVSHANQDLCYYTLRALLEQQISEDYVKVDTNRIYGSGQSAGSSATQTFVRQHPEFYAAAASTSFAVASEGVGEYIPTYLQTGQSDLGNLLPDLWGSATLQGWIEYLFKANGLDTDINSWTSAVEDGRYHVYTWENHQGIPMVQWGQTQMRVHNCYPAEMPLLWNFMKHYSYTTDENGYVTARYYSESAFAEDDLVEIEKQDPETVATDLTEENVPKIDVTRGNKLPLTGYLNQEIKVGETTRTVKLYIADGAPVRTYMTIINVPDGVDTYKFLKDNGWIDLMNERHEGLFVLEPGEDGWGTAEEEQAYIAEAMKAYNTRKWYSNYSTSYAVGYGEGGSALQAYVMSKPTAFISAVFADAFDIPDAYLTATAATVNDAQTDIKKGDIPVPVWEVNGSNDKVVDYWKNASKVGETPETKDGITVYKQAEEILMTSYTKGVVSKVMVQDDVENVYSADFTKAAYEFMSEYTRYENNWANGNALMLRPDYEKLGVEIREMDLDGYKREYMVYVPESIRDQKNIPTVYVMAGNTQTDRVFFDATSWWQVADDYGFMIVVPCEQFNTAVDMTWNITGYKQGSETATSDDVAFLKAIIAEVDKDFATDTTRRYVTGQSFGSMWTNFCAVYMDEYFAAFGSTSGHIDFAIDENAGTSKVPVWLFAGQYDIFDWDFNKDVTSGFSLKNTINYYLNRNDLGTLDDNVKTVDGRYTTYTWSNEAGIPLYSYTQTAGRNHNCIPSEDRMIWENWFSKWTKVDGTRYYEGKAIDAEEPVAPTGVEGFVTRLYENVLGRTPDQKGLDAWVNVLKNGTNGGEEVAKGFIFSDEYTKKNTSNDAFVEMLYNTLLNRKSDAAGKKAWVAQLDNKLATREEIVEGFIHSNEFIGICGEYGIFTTAAEAFAARLYTKCLGRSYDKKGLKAWADLLHSRKIGGGEAAKGFFFSDEFQNLKLDNKEFVTRCYRTFLNREPDAQGLANWMNVLAQSNDRASVLDGFIGSSEYAKLCVSYGIDK